MVLNLIFNSFISHPFRKEGLLVDFLGDTSDVIYPQVKKHLDSLVHHSDALHKSDNFL